MRLFRSGKHRLNERQQAPAPAASLADTAVLAAPLPPLPPIPPRLADVPTVPWHAEDTFMAPDGPWAAMPRTYVPAFTPHPARYVPDLLADVHELPLFRGAIACQFIRQERARGARLEGAWPEQYASTWRKRTEAPANARTLTGEAA